MFKHFLVLLADTPLAEGVLRHTLTFARVFAAQVTLLWVLEASPSKTLVAAFDCQMRKVEAEAALAGMVGPLQAAGVSTQVVKIVGQSASSVMNYVHHHGVDLVIWSTLHDHRGAGGDLGSRLPAMLRRSRIASLHVRADPPMSTNQSAHRSQRLLAPWDSAPRRLGGLPFVTTLAYVYGTHLLLIHVLCQPLRAHHPPGFPQISASTEQRLARQYEAVARHLAPRKRPDAALAEHLSSESEEVASCLHALAQATAMDLVIFHVQCCSANSQWPYSRVITNFLADGVTPLLVVQIRSVARTPLLAVNTLHQIGDQVSITLEHLPPTWLYD
jgi:nucleotide-binding universal stress UspA family protein